MPLRPPVSPQAAKRQYERARRQRDGWRQWFGSSRWKQMRAAQLFQPLCERCKAAPATVANHKTPHRGDAELFWCGPLESVCASCHSSAIQVEENRSGGGDGEKICGLGGLYRLGPPR
jgi:5-methylcytosine-specific restriction enzyme A